MAKIVPIPSIQTRPLKMSEYLEASKTAPTEVEQAVSSQDSEDRQMEGHEDREKVINYRTCTWQKTAALLCAQYIALPVMSFPASYAVLGLFPAIVLTLAIAAMVFYTSMITWRFCLRHPEIRDICDAGQLIFWNSPVAWYLTAMMFVLNNSFVAGIHVLIGARYLGTVASPDVCNIVYAVIVTVVSFAFAIPRTFAALSRIALATAFFTFVSILLAIIFCATQAHPAGFDSGELRNGFRMVGDPTYVALTPPSTTWIAAVNSFLNISYTLIGQTTLPSYIAAMSRPEDFPKALTAVTIFEVVLFTITGAIIYVYVGAQYITSPAFTSLENDVLVKVSFSFMVPTLIFTGSLYSSISCRFIFFRLFSDSRHRTQHTIKGWMAWIGILCGLWILTFIIAEVIPFFGDLLSLMSAIFDSFFGFIFWAVADTRLRSISLHNVKAASSPAKALRFLVINAFLLLVGLFMLGVGSYTSVESIIQSFRTSDVSNVFSCATNPF